jgi:hypothetical protein
LTLDRYGHLFADELDALAVALDDPQVRLFHGFFTDCYRYRRGD